MRSTIAMILVAAAANVASAQPGNAPLDPYAPQPKAKAPAPTPAPGPAAGPVQGPPAPPPAKTPAAPAPAPVGPAAPPSPAGPNDPYTPPPAQQDSVLAEQVAGALVARAQELYDARVFADAKQLAVEALAKSPKGAAAEQAKFLIKAINQQLGIKDDEDKQPKVDLTPIEDPTKKVDKVDTSPEVPNVPASRLTASVHGGAYVGLLGATVGAFIDKENPASGAVPIGIGVGLLAGLYGPRAIEKLHWNEGQLRTAGSGTVWGGAFGGLLADAVRTENTTARGVMLGASIGATVGGVGAGALATKNQFTPGDIALVDTLAGIGAVGGLTIGMLMQPVEGEAYNVNAMFGIGGGIIVGLIAAPQTNTTPRRMLRVAGAAAIGGALPFALYAGIYDKSSHADERITGLLSSAGLVVGAYLGFRFTRGMDEGLDVLPGAKAKKKDVDDAPPAIVGRSSRGQWNLGALGVQPLSPELAPQPGMAVPLLGGAW